MLSDLNCNCVTNQFIGKSTHSLHTHASVVHRAETHNESLQSSKRKELLDVPRSLHSIRWQLPIYRFTAVANDTNTEHFGHASPNGAFRSLYDENNPGVFSTGSPKVCLDNCPSNSEKLDALDQAFIHFPRFCCGRQKTLPAVVEANPVFTYQTIP